MTIIEKMRKDGYPKIIKGNGGYRAYLKDMQPLGGGDYMAIYRYPGGECCHSLEEIQKCFEIIEQQPPQRMPAESLPAAWIFWGMFPECTLTIEYLEMMRYYINSIHLIQN